MAVSVLHNLKRISLISLQQKCLSNCFTAFEVKPIRKMAYMHVIKPFKYDEDTKETIRKVPEEFKEVYPDMLPSANPKLRNFLREKLEREDMLARRSVIDIPEFYVGSIVRVSLSDNNATGKVNKFTGICIGRQNAAVLSNFTLRNVIDNIGVELTYDLYCPLVLRVECLRLEKSLDPHLFYLRDCLPEYSRFPQDMDAEPSADGAPVQIREVKAELKPKPWFIRWELHDLKGVKDRQYHMWDIVNYQKNLKPWEKYDLLKEYREGITEEDQAKVYRHILPHLPKLDAARRRIKRTRDD